MDNASGRGNAVSLNVLRNVDSPSKRAVNVGNYRSSRDLLMGHGNPLLDPGAGTFGVSFAGMDLAARRENEPTLTEWRAQKRENENEPNSWRLNSDWVGRTVNPKHSSVSASGWMTARHS
jgi:hypothetical protein